MSETSTLIPCTGKITRAELAQVPTPPATTTHVPIPHVAVVEGLVETLKHLARTVHELYFTPQHQEFESRTMWNLSNAFTSAFKELDPIPQFRATTKLSQFLEAASAG